MSKTAMWIVIVIVVLVIAGGIWWYMSQGTYTNPYPSQSQAQNNNSGTSQLPSGNSDQAISQEMTNVNTQMNGLSSDSASINQGLNDQPVQQSQY